MRNFSPTLGVDVGSQGGIERLEADSALAGCNHVVGTASSDADAEGLPKFAPRSNSVFRNAMLFVMTSHFSHLFPHASSS